MRKSTMIEFGGRYFRPKTARLVVESCEVVIVGTAPSGATVELLRKKPDVEGYGNSFNVAMQELLKRMAGAVAKLNR